MRIILTLSLMVTTASAETLPIDPLWKSETFRKAVTGSFGIDSRIEPRITEDEEFYLDKSAQAMADGDPEAAIAAFAESSLLEESPIMLFSVATLQFQADEKEAAAENFGKALEQFPNFRDAHRNLAIVLVQQEKFDEAKKHLVRAIELGSREALTMGLLGYCHATSEHYRAALDAYRLAVLTAPEERQWIQGLANSLRALDKSKEAASVYQQLIDQEPTDLQTWLAQSDTFVNLDNPVAAVANLEFAHRSKSLEPNGLVSLGHLYLGEDLADLAIARYEEALTAENPVALAKAVEIVEQLTNRQRWEDSQRIAGILETSPVYQTQLQNEKTDPRLLSRLYRSRALVGLEMGNSAEGAKLIEDWLMREPTDGLAILLLARFRQEEGKREEAEMLLERAARDPEHAAAANLAQGKWLVEAGEYETAIEHLEAAQNLDPKPSVSEYLEAVRELLE